MGKRILDRLNELGWKQTDLCARVPELEPQALNILIKRDSKTSKFAPQIAEAIGYELQFLLTGEGEKYIKPSGTTHSDIAFTDKDGNHYAVEVKSSQEAQSLIDLIRHLDLMKSIPQSTFKSINLLLTSLEDSAKSTKPEGHQGGLAPDAVSKFRARAEKNIPPKKDDDSTGQN